MAYIYKITNNINGKIYIGKTSQNVEKRFKQHIKDSKKHRMEKRPLYDAINKYGVGHFSAEMLEECSESDACDREQYWIKYYDSYHNGYNATTGGDGKSWCDYNAIFDLYQRGLSFREIGRQLKYDPTTCKNAVVSVGVSKEELDKRKIRWIMNPVVQYDIQSGQIINVFKSAKEAARKFGKKKCTNISNAIIRGTNKAYGFGWKRISIDEYLS